jgi:hypothetical protein
MRAIEKLALVESLRAADIGLVGRALDVRAAAQHWLSYIPSTFPHYTQISACGEVD